MPALVNSSFNNVSLLIKLCIQLKITISHRISNHRNCKNFKESLRHITCPLSSRHIGRLRWNICLHLRSPPDDWTTFPIWARPRFLEISCSSFCILWPPCSSTLRDSTPFCKSRLGWTVLTIISACNVNRNGKLT